MVKNKRPYNDFLDKFREATKAQIIAVLRNEEPLTVRAVAVRTGLSYRTAQGRLFELVAEGAVALHSIDEKTKVFFVNPEFKKEEQEP